MFINMVLDALVTSVTNAFSFDKFLKLLQLLESGQNKKHRFLNAFLQLAAEKKGFEKQFSQKIVWPFLF